jgi:glycosyltransferase involved in cell wall biosynthesis
MNKRLVSIIIPTFNSSVLIRGTLNSVLNQTYTHWECIIVDDGSTDDTFDVVNDFINDDKRMNFYIRPDNIPKGPNASRNYGILKSTGNFVMSLDSDDLLHKNHLESKVKIFNENLLIDCVLSKTILVNYKGKEISKETRTFLTGNLLEDFITLKVSWYMHDTMWKRSFLKDKVHYNEDLLKMLDRDFHIRRLLENPKIHLLDEYLSYYRVYNGSNSSNQKIEVLESRHRAVIEIIKLLKKENALSRSISLFFLKFQIKNVVVLYKSKKCKQFYLELIKYTFIFNTKSIIWVIKLVLGYISFKLTKRGLRFVK